jgi:hypothetical protein
MNNELRQELIEAGYVGDFDLSSLVRACGDKFDGIVPGNTIGFIAPPRLLDKDMSNPYIQEYLYNSPVFYTKEEAVAHLYIALNKK